MAPNEIRKSVEDNFELVVQTTYIASKFKKNRMRTEK